MSVSLCLYSCNFMHTGSSLIRRVSPYLLPKSAGFINKIPYMPYATATDKIDVLDEQGVKTGEVLSRKRVHELGKIHRAVHLYLFENSSKQLLLQRRASDVDHYPGKWSISVTGHVDAGENSKQAVARELQEELQMDPARVKIDFVGSSRQDVTLSPTYIDRQFNDLYVGWANFKIEDIRFNPKEVSEVRLIPLTTFAYMVYKRKDNFALYEQECKLVVPWLKKML